MARPHFGLAIAPTGLTVVRLDRSARLVGSCTLPPLKDADEIWAEASRCLTDLLGQSSIDKARLSVVLLPPLVQLRRIDLPRLSDAELRTVLSRDAGRYFIGVDGPQVVGFRRVGRGTRGSAPILGACAPAWLIQRVMSLASHSGGQLEALAPAAPGWAAQAVESAGDCQLVVATPGSTTVVPVRSGRAESCRRVPAWPDAVIAALREAAGSTVILLDGGAELASRLTEVGFRVVQPSASATEFAARGARASHRLELVPAEVARDRYLWARQVSRRLWVGTAALLALSVALARWDTARETDAVRVARAAHQEQVAASLERRARLDRARSRLEFLDQAESQAPRWTGVLAALAGRLPGDAWLGAFRAAGDSILLEGSADQASRAFEALQRAPVFAGIQATAPIRQVNGDDETPVERFSLTARLRVRDTVP